MVPFSRRPKRFFFFISVQSEQNKGFRKRSREYLAKQLHLWLNQAEMENSKYARAQMMFECLTVQWHNISPYILIDWADVGVGVGVGGQTDGGGEFYTTAS